MLTRSSPIVLVLVWTFWHGTALGGAAVDGIEGLDFCDFHTLSVPNNDDYAGEFADNPNQLQLWASISMTTERVVPTLPSGGITEYALTVGGGNGPWLLDTYAELQLGFGTGENFVHASQVSADLRFDTPDAINPPIPDFYPISTLNEPVLDFLHHRGDCLLFRGTSHADNLAGLVFNAPSMLNVPLDVPDLPASVRDFYTTDELADLEPEAVPFTLRFVPMWLNALPIFYGDFDYDFDVDGDDFLIWQAGFGTFSPYPDPDEVPHSIGNADHDNDVDGDDFLMWQSDFGTAIPPMYGYAAAAVPEPTSITLLLVALVGAVLLVRRQ